MKTRKTRSSIHDFGRRTFDALRMALACVAAAGSFTNSTNAITLPTAEDLCVVEVSTLSTPIELKGSDPNGLPLTFRLDSVQVHGDLSGTPPNLIYIPDHDFVGIDGFRYVVSNGRQSAGLRPGGNGHRVASVRWI